MSETGVNMLGLEKVFRMRADGYYLPHEHHEAIGAGVDLAIKHGLLVEIEAPNGDNDWRLAWIADFTDQEVRDYPWIRSVWD